MKKNTKQINTILAAIVMIFVSFSSPAQAEIRTIDELAQWILDNPMATVYPVVRVDVYAVVIEITGDDVFVLINNEKLAKVNGYNARIYGDTEDLKVGEKVIFEFHNSTLMGDFNSPISTNTVINGTRILFGSANRTKVLKQPAPSSLDKFLKLK